jgi:hypothetical protein
MTHDHIDVTPPNFMLLQQMVSDLLGAHGIEFWDNIFGFYVLGVGYWVFGVWCSGVLGAGQKQFSHVTCTLLRAFIYIPYSPFPFRTRAPR